MNVKLLRKVKKHILEEPKRLMMQGWRRKKSHDRPTVLAVDKDGLDENRPFARCGTAACIGGWACIIAKKEPEHYGDHFRVARKLLELTSLQASRLFAPSLWPGDFMAGTTDDGKKKTAQIAAARIEHFIKTKGRE